MHVRLMQHAMMPLTPTPPRPVQPTSIHIHPPCGCAHLATPPHLRPRASSSASAASRQWARPLACCAWPTTPPLPAPSTPCASASTSCTSAGTAAVQASGAASMGQICRRSLCVREYLGRHAAGQLLTALLPAAIDPPYPALCKDAPAAAALPGPATTGSTRTTTSSTWTSRRLTMPWRWWLT